MKQNMGMLDRIVRGIVVAIIVILYLAGQLTGTAAIILGIIAAAFLLTSLVGVCPAYLPLGLSTVEKDKMK